MRSSWSRITEQQQAQVRNTAWKIHGQQLLGRPWARNGRRWTLTDDRHTLTDDRGLWTKAPEPMLLLRTTASALDGRPSMLHSTPERLLFLRSTVNPQEDGRRSKTRQQHFTKYCSPTPRAPTTSEWDSQVQTNVQEHGLNSNPKQLLHTEHQLQASNHNHSQTAHRRIPSFNRSPHQSTKLTQLTRVRSLCFTLKFQWKRMRRSEY